MLGTIAAAAAIAAAPQETYITIYSQPTGQGIPGYGFALIKELRELELSQGVQEIRIEDVAATIEANSVAIEPVGAPNLFSVLEQNYQYDLISPTAILNKAVGETIFLNQVMPDGTTRRLEGTLLSSPTSVVSNDRGQTRMTYNGMVLETTDGRILLSPEGTVEVPDLPEGLISKPTLMWLLNSNESTTADVELSYLANQISWKSDYVLSLGQDGEVGDLHGWVTINNQTGTSFQDANLKLLAGDVQRIQPQRSPGGMGGGGYPEGLYRGRAEESLGMTQEAFAEYHLYTLQRPATVRNKEIKQITLLEGDDIQVEKKLVVDPLRRMNTYRPREENAVGSGEIKPSIYIEFENNEENGLGIPMPAGIFKVYQEDSSGSTQLLGEDRIEHTPREERLSLRVGAAFDIIAERVRTDFEWLRRNQNSPSGYNWGVRETFEIELRNRKEVADTVHVIERHWGDWEVIETSQPFEELSSNAFQYVVDLEPNEVKTVTFTIETYWP
jgi:hypothetical protein